MCFADVCTWTWSGQPWTLKVATKITILCLGISQRQPEMKVLSAKFDSRLKLAEIADGGRPVEERKACVVGVHLGHGLHRGRRAVERKATSNERVDRWD